MQIFIHSSGSDIPEFLGI